MFLYDIGAVATGDGAGGRPAPDTAATIDEAAALGEAATLDDAATLDEAATLGEAATLDDGATLDEVATTVFVFATRRPLLPPADNPTSTPDAANASSAALSALRFCFLFSSRSPTGRRGSPGPQAS